MSFVTLFTHFPEFLKVSWFKKKKTLWEEEKEKMIEIQRHMDKHRRL